MSTLKHYTSLIAHRVVVPSKMGIKNIYTYQQPIQSLRSHARNPHTYLANFRKIPWLAKKNHNIFITSYGKHFCQKVPKSWCMCTQVRTRATSSDVLGVTRLTMHFQMAMLKKKMYVNFFGDMYFDMLFQSERSRDAKMFSDFQLRCL